MAGVVALFFHRTGQLAQRDDGHIHLFGHDLEVAGDGADLLHPVLAALARGHQLQVVDDDQPDVGPAGVLVDPADLGLHLGDGDGGGVVHVDGRVVQLFGGQGQVFPVGGGQRAGAERLAVDAGFGREDAVGQLLFRHFQAEDGHRDVLLHGHAAADLLQVGQGLHHAGRKGRQGAGVPARADLIEALLSVFQQQGGVRLVAGVLQNTGSHPHQLADQVLFLDDLGVCLDVGNAGHRLGQAGQVDLGLVRAGEDVVRHHRVQQGDKVDGLVAGEQPHHLGIDAAVLGSVEHLRADDLHQIGQNVGLEQHRAQDALFRLHTVGRLDAHAFQVQIMAARAAAFVRHT